MAAKRDPPFAQFNFVVDVGDGGAEGPDAGFQEVSNLGLEIGVSELRSGVEPTGRIRKISGLNKAADVTLKRGAMGSERLSEWLAAVRSDDPGQHRTVRITLRSEDRKTVVAAWVLSRARILKYTPGPLNAKGGGEVAIEALTLAHEGLELDGSN